MTQPTAQKRYGCIGEKLTHSFSKEIHAQLASYSYELIELTREELLAFAMARDFAAINVTIPYKELILPYLSHIDEAAQAIGAVNTVVNRGGELWGYNTDVYGMTALLSHAGVCVKDKKVLILGTGGTSKTAVAVARACGARTVLRVSRDGREGAITYDDAYRAHTDAQVVINTTPCGMYPRCYETPIDITRFPALTGVIDAIYNPLRTPLVLSAMERGIAAEGGLYMLVAQAVRASEIFLDTTYAPEVTDRVYRRILSQKQNTVLIGMPASGKSTVGRLLAKRQGRPLIDTDARIVERYGAPITDIFRMHGEAYFRDLEAEVIREVAMQTACVIATGGGAILREDNVRALRANGRLYFLDRPIEQLVPTASRPLAKDAEAIRARHRERYDRYLRCADVTVDAGGEAAHVADLIEGDIHA